MNKDILDYLDKYCKDKGILHEEAMAHAIVKEYIRWKKEEEDGAETRLQSAELKQSARQQDPADQVHYSRVESMRAAEEWE